MYQLFIKFNDGHKLSINVNEDWTVIELKKAVIDQLGRDVECPPVPPVASTDVVDVSAVSAVRVIFAGIELSESLKIKDYDIPDGSELHVFIRKIDHVTPDRIPKELTDNDLCSSLVSSFSDLEISTNSQEEDKITEVNSAELRKKPCFHVFCKQPCGMITRGKLRVCCRTCKKGAFTVSQDVTCWEDIFTPGKISGCCQLNGCSGNQSEFYFKCANHQSSEDRVPALNLVKTNTREVPCLTCEDVSDPVLVFPCEFRHVICLECFKLYCHTKLNDRQFIQHVHIGYTLPCPAGCENSFIEETHHFRILGNDEYNKYQSFATEECVLQNGGVLCPAPGCGAAIFVEEGVRRLQCIQHREIGCGFVFCRECRSSFHDGECDNEHVEAANLDGYHVDMSRAERARWDRATRTTIQTTTKPCPNCKAPVEKNGGCMHMHCPRAGCKYEWCWLCGIAWNNDCMALHWFGEEPFFF